MHPATVDQGRPVRRRPGEDAPTGRLRGRAARPRRARPAEGEQADDGPLQEGERAADAGARARSGSPPATTLKAGDQVLLRHVRRGERVDVIGTGRGKGFQGVVKRHHFAGGAATHGSMFHRAPGSIGASSFPSRVVKGMRAAGRMGGRRTTHNLKVLRVDAGEPPADRRGRHPGRAASYVIVARPSRPDAQGRAGREAEEGQEVAMATDRRRQQEERRSAGRRAATRCSAGA